MMTPTVLTLPVEEAEILLTLIGTHGPRIRMIETIMEEEEDLDSKEILLNTLKAIEAKLWTS